MKVIIYSTPTCPYCNMAKSYFASKNIDFTDVDVSADHEKAHEMVHKTGQTGVPVIEIGDQVIIGFDQPKIDDILSKKEEK